VSTGGERRSEVAAGLDRVRERVAAGCAAAGRSPSDICLVVVTKTHPATDVGILAGLGVTDVAENRDQEASAKHAACEQAGLALRWHFVGRLQTNKARSVAQYADVVHSVDRTSLVTALGKAAHQAGRRVECLVQVSLDGDTARGGCLLEDLEEVATAVVAADGLALRGLMAVAPLGADPYRAFAALPGLRDRLLAVDPGAGLVSAGMSGDLEAAIACGATHLRVGSAVLGARPPLG
jgi:hypothetical protein